MASTSGRFDLDQVLAVSPIGIAFVDDGGVIVRANDCGRDTLGPVGSRFDARFSDETARDRERGVDGARESPVAAVVGTGESVFGVHHRLTQPDGSTTWISANYAPLEDGAAGSERVVVAFEEITELKQREAQLSRLQRVNSLIRKVDQAVVRSDSRDEIEAVVCRELTAGAPYDLAVIGAFGPELETYTPRTWAGVDLGGGYLATVLDAADGTDLRDSIAADAARTGDVHVVQDLSEASRPVFERTADEYGFESYASIPVRNGDLRYGVVSVFSTRPSAFDDAERAVLAEVGETIGHALTALDRKTALETDEALEVELESESLAEPFLAAASGDPAAMESSITETVPVDDGAQLQFYSARNVDPERFVETLRSFPNVTEVSTVTADGDQVRVVVKTTAETVRSVFAELGGRTTETRVVDGRLRVVAEVPPTQDLRAMKRRVQDLYPSLSMTSKRLRERPTETMLESRATIEARLTDRQRQVLETALEAGYFEWPRHHSKEDLASYLDITSPTLSQHLREAQRRIFSSVFADEDVEPVPPTE